jgi:hypothetical protein
MSTAAEAKDCCARGAQPTPEGPVRARGRSLTRKQHAIRSSARRANRRARRRAIATRPTLDRCTLTRGNEAEV